MEFAKSLIFDRFRTLFGPFSDPCRNHRYGGTPTLLAIGHPVGQWVTDRDSVCGPFGSSTRHRVDRRSDLVTDIVLDLELVIAPLT